MKGFIDNKRLQKLLVIIFLIELIFIIDMITPVSLAELYILPLIITFFEFSLATSAAVMLLSLFLTIFPEGYDNINISFIEKHGIIAISYFFVFLILKKVKDQHIELQKKEKMLNNALKNIQYSKNMILESYIKALESKDRYTQGHSKKVAEYAKKIAEELKCPRDEIDYIYKSAYLHDLGKIIVDREILNKIDRLSLDEWREVKKHPEVGAEILSQIPDFKELALAVKHHHERYDGKGYPYGLKGRNIPLASRIIAVADSFEAMISDRSYRKAMKIDEVVEELERNKGTQFDPEIVEIFLRVLEKEGFICSSETGISPNLVGHGIFFYKDQASLKRIVFELISDAVMNKMKIITCYDEVIARIIARNYRKEVLKGQISIQDFTQYDWYGENIPYSMKENLKQLCGNALQEGYKGLVIMGDGNYISREIGFKNLLIAERYINEIIEGLLVNIICMYSKETKLDSRSNELVNSHLYEIKDGNVIRIKNA